MTTIISNPVSVNRFIAHNTPAQAKGSQSANSVESKTSMSGAQILANQNIAFMSRHETSSKNSLPYYDKSIVADEPDGHYSYYLRNNPEEYYIRNGFQINNFLRNGKLEPITESVDDVADIFKDIVRKEVNEKKDYNRSVVDSVEIIDSLLESRTDDDMVVYRYAPTAWLKTEKDGKLVDKGFFSTTTVKGSATDAYVDPKNKTCFEVWVPKNTPFLDLRDRGEHEMLFARNLEFNIIGENMLEMIPQPEAVEESEE